MFKQPPRNPFIIFDQESWAQAVKVKCKEDWSYTGTAERYLCSWAENKDYQQLTIFKKHPDFDHTKKDDDGSTKYHHCKISQLLGMQLRFQVCRHSGCEEECSTDDVELMDFSDGYAERAEDLKKYGGHEELLVLRYDEYGALTNIMAEQVEAFAAYCKEEGQAMIADSKSDNPQEAFKVHQEKFENEIAMREIDCSVSGISPYGLPALSNRRKRQRSEGL